MARLDTLIPFILYFEAGVSRKWLTLPNALIFEKAKATGYANDPIDVGGATMCGVTLNTYREYCRRERLQVPDVSKLRSISYQQWHDIIKTMYWDRWRADEINEQSVANMLVDWVWASGSYGIKIPQRILGVVQDGIVGEKTIAALNKRDGQELFREIRDARMKYTDDIIESSIRKYEKRIGRKSTLAEQKRYTNRKYENGWKRRIGCITYDGLRYE